MITILMFIIIIMSRSRSQWASSGSPDTVDVNGLAAELQRQAYYAISYLYNTILYHSYYVMLYDNIRQYSIVYNVL